MNNSRFNDAHLRAYFPTTKMAEDFVKQEQRALVAETQLAEVRACLTVMLTLIEERLEMKEVTDKNLQDAIDRLEHMKNLNSGNLSTNEEFTLRAMRKLQVLIRAGATYGLPKENP